MSKYEAIGWIWCISCGFVLMGGMITGHEKVANAGAYALIGTFALAILGLFLAAVFVLFHA